MGLLHLELKKIGEVRDEVINLDGLYQKLAFVMMNGVKEEKKEISSDIFTTFEKEFGRTLSPMEYEIIKAWLEGDYTEELVLLALKEAIYNGVSNLRYIDRILHEWYKKGYFPKDALTVNDTEAKKTGKYAVMRDAGTITEDGEKSSASYGFPCVDLEVENHGVASADDFRTGQAISRTSKHPEEAIKILNLVWKDPYISNTLAYGIEGVDYVYESGKGTDNPTVLPKEGADRTWALWHNFIGPLFDQWDSSWNSTEALQEIQRKDAEATISKKASVQFDTQSITTELAALSEIWQSSERVLQYGVMTDFDEYISDLDKKCKAAGIEKVINELNKQYKEAKSK